MDTGDYAPVVPIQRRRYAYPSGRYATIGEEVQGLIVYDLTVLDLKIFLMLLVEHAEGEYRKVVVSQVATTLGTYPANASNSLARLVAIVAVLKGPKDGRSYTYMVNPLLAFRGPGERHRQVYLDHAEPLAALDEVGTTGKKARSTGRGAR
jgi:hypothetical protein